jgi:hypothetical protein
MSCTSYCERLITRLEESYRVFVCYCVLSRNLKNEEAMGHVRSQRYKEIKWLTATCRLSATSVCSQYTQKDGMP